MSATSSLSITNNEATTTEQVWDAITSIANKKLTKREKPLDFLKCENMSKTCNNQMEALCSSCCRILCERCMPLHVGKDECNVLTWEQLYEAFDELRKRICGRTIDDCLTAVPAGVPLHKEAIVQLPCKDVITFGTGIVKEFSQNQFETGKDYVIKKYVKPANNSMNQANCLKLFLHLKLWMNDKRRLWQS